MKSTPLAWLRRGMTVAFLFGAAVVPAFVARASTDVPYPGGDGPGGGVRGHIDIPEIRFGTPGTHPANLFDSELLDGDDDWWKAPVLAIAPPPPGPVLPPEYSNYRVGGDLLTPAPVGSWDRLPTGDALLPAPSFTSPPAVWAPTSSIPAPGVGALVAAALASFGARRRRRAD